MTTTNDDKNSNDKEIKRFYPIGTPGKPWNDEERAQWKAQTKIQRSYKEEVLKKIDDLKADNFFVVEQYGALSHNPERYPLMVVKTRNDDDDRSNEKKPNVLITGGVHGYETSGVQGALLFLKEKAKQYAADFNLVVAPCVSPWAYEHIQRWQADLKDPNRSFKIGAQTEESKALMDLLDKLNCHDQWTCHLDLHETTNTDATEFMPAKHAEAGLPYDTEEIPDGFYIIGGSMDSLDFFKAVIESVRAVTHIAPPDSHGNILDEPVVSDGIIIVPVKDSGLCRSITKGKYALTTEVYPDSPKVTDDICNLAQVAAVTGALDYILANTKK